jgi:hypothetical protein
MMVKTIHAASLTGSFAEASENLSVLAEAEISANRIGRLVTRIGTERMAEVQQQALEFEALPLPARKTSPVEITPELACVQCDGGRLQIRDRLNRGDQAKDSKSTFWRESKVGALIKMTGKVYDHDPCPEIPRIFVDPRRMSRLTREIKGFSGDRGEPAKNEADPDGSKETSQLKLIEPNELHADVRPEPLVRSVIATTQNMSEFGRLLAGQAYSRGFMAATKKAFVCDGMACNWKLQEKYFPHFTPILDFVHAICYVYHAAIGGAATAQAWERYCQWAQLLWSGETEALLKKMKLHQAEIGLPESADSDSSPRQLLADAIRYVTNQQSRMKYAEYRRLGLPSTSAPIESTIKQVSRRVKGTEKFWSVNADPMLQLRADMISETTHMDNFWSQRSENLSSFTHYKMAG